MGEEETYRCGFDDGGKSVFKINVGYLRVAFYNKLSLKSRIGGFSVFDPEGELGADDFAIAKAWDDGVSAILVH